MGDFGGSQRGPGEVFWEPLGQDGFQRALGSDFGRFSSILGGFGLHFGRFFGAKSEKVPLESDFKRKPKNKAIKSHARIPDKP